MKLHILHDTAGRIVAAADISQGASGPRPVAGKGQRELVIDVPPEHGAMSFLEVCQNLRVDTRNRSLVHSSKLKRPRDRTKPGARKRR